VVDEKLAKMLRLFYDNITARCTVREVIVVIATTAACFLRGFGLVVINTGWRRFARYSVSKLYLPVKFCRRCPLVTSVYCEKTAETIQMPFDVVVRVEQRNRVLDGRAHQCHLANTVERLCAAAVSGSATRGGDAACSQITLGKFVH